MSILSKIRSKRWKYLLSGSKVTLEEGAELIIGRGVSIKDSVIYVSRGCRCVIGEGTQIKESTIYLQGDSVAEIGKCNTIAKFEIAVYDGRCTIGDYNILSKSTDGYPPRFEVRGSLRVGSYNRISCVIWIRFKGAVTVGDRNAINQRTEIRADECVSIGSYNQISYDCAIWDTNTHNMYSAEKRREITDRQYPDFGLEFEKPVTKPVHIGDDCWISRGVSILKGVTIGDKCVVAYGTTILKGEYKANSTIMNEVSMCVKENNL
ncbi:MAG: DapH/DapD/GlmU-related protein [Rikenellaceae bacterium]